MNDKLINYSVHQKDWYKNMDNIIINFRHMGEGNHLYLIHMNKKCRIDRLVGNSKAYNGECGGLGGYSKIFRGY